MVAYQGEVKFEHAGSGGLSRMMKRMATGEGVKLMKLTGTGEVFLADHAQEVHLIQLADERITVASENLLAFEAGIEWNIRKVEGASGVMAGGLFNLELSRHRDGGPGLSRPADAARAGRHDADLRRPAGGDHLVERRAHLDQDRRRAQDADRADLGREPPDGVRGTRAGCWSSRPRVSSATAPRASGGALGNMLGG